MEHVLVEALLAHCGDPCALLQELSGWDGAFPPDFTDRLETLRLVLRRLSARSEQTAGSVGAPLQQAVRVLALGHLVPLLGEPGLEAPTGRADSLRLTRATCGALLHCAEICGPPLAAQVAAAAVRSLERCGGPGLELQLDASGLDTELPHGRVSVEGAIEALGAVLPLLLGIPDGPLEPYRLLVQQVARASLAVLRSGPAEVAALLAGRLLPVLAADGAVLQMLWGGLDLSDEDGGAEAWESPRLMGLLSSLCEQLLPEEGSPGAELRPRLSCSFWRAVQRGLTSADSLSRKRALHLLRRAQRHQPHWSSEAERQDKHPHEPRLFWWSIEKNEELVQFWENYILIMETLEGNQIHVIKPVFPKLNYLFELAVSEEKGCWLFHPSWHLCIYERMLKSENKTLVREGVVHFLELYETIAPPGSLTFCDFIIGPLLDAVSESSLFSRSQGQIIGACPPLGLKLENFLARFITSLPEQNKGCFLLRFIQKMTSRHWCAVPILFLSKALAHIPACRPWGGEGLLALRKVLQCTMSTHEILLRGAAQCYLLQAAMNLTDVEKVSHGEIASFLMALKSEESLCRGTMLWKEVCEWLHVNDHCFRRSSLCEVQQDRSLLSIYVQSLVEDYLRASATEGEISPVPDLFEANLVATMILMAADVDGLKSKVNDGRTEEWKELKCFLYPLLDSLIKLSTNPYLPKLKTDKSLQLLLKLLQNTSLTSSTLNEDGLLMCIWTYFMPSAPNILEFVLRRLTSELRTVSDLDRCNLYLAVLSELVNLSSKTSLRGISVWNFIFSLTNSSIQTLQKTSNEQEPTLAVQIQKVVSMASLAWVCEIVSHAHEMQLESEDAIKTLIGFVSSIHLNQTLKKPNCNEDQISVLDELSSSQGWGKIVARYIHDQWVCAHFILRTYRDLIVTSEDMMTEPPLLIVQKPKTTLQNALEALSILPSDQVLPVFHCMKILVPKLLNSAEPLCIQSINTVWKVISSLCNTQLIFWANLKAFVQFVFDPELLASAARSRNQAFLNIKEIIRRLIDMSNAKTGVFNVVMNYCCQSWIAPLTNDGDLSENPFLNARSYIELVTEACVFGTVFRRDQRLLQDVHAFIQNLGDDCSANNAMESTSKDEHYVRVCAIKFLCWLDGSSASHKAFLEDLVLKLLDKDELVSKSKIRYYANSLQHRVKNRLWQTLLVLFPKLDQNFVNKIIERIFMAGFSNNQASVKYLIEWLLILILHKYPQILPRFWDCFCCTEEKGKTSICTFLAVLTHFDTVIQATSEKLLPLKKALIVVLQWCFNHNFSVRLYALIALKKLWTMSKDLSVNEFETLAAVIESSLHQVETMQGAGNAKKNWQKIQEHFFFSTFHPLEDYSIETIFYTLPSLSEVVEEEWIPACKFSNFQDIPLNSAFKLFNPRSELHDLTASDWSQQDIGFNSTEVDTQPEWADVQKKIIPCKNRISDLDLEIVCLDRAAKIGKSNGSLIVVASLIDKPANLGGLCRTSEIFGASALVVDSLHYVNDKQFQYLSVSSEQWLPLVEVKTPQLVDYLQQKKTEGYTIIGVEQTAKSADLTEYTFPEKSLLLLGNEREGIPANLIQHLDVCVEIPQQGIIRSLNVHVSGALLIWEYTKQQIMKQKRLK